MNNFCKERLLSDSCAEAKDSHDVASCDIKIAKEETKIKVGDMVFAFRIGMSTQSSFPIEQYTPPGSELFYGEVIVSEKNFSVVKSEHVIESHYINHIPFFKTVPTENCFTDFYAARNAMIESIRFQNQRSIDDLTNQLESVVKDRVEYIESWMGTYGYLVQIKKQRTQK